MIRHPTYTLAAHRKTVLLFAKRLLATDFLPVEGDPATPKKQLFCEDSAYADRVVSEAAIHDVIDFFALLQEEQEKIQAQFELRERAPVTLPQEVLDRQQRTHVPEEGKAKAPPPQGRKGPKARG